MHLVLKILKYCSCIFFLSCVKEQAVEMPEKSSPLEPQDTISFKHETIDTNHKNNTVSYLSSYEIAYKELGLVDLQEAVPDIRIKLMYADTANFLHRVIYDSLFRAYSVPLLAEKLKNSQAYLKKLNPRLSLLVCDAARPHHIQKLLWDSVKIDPRLRINYIAKPENISLHNYGAAIDVTIIDTEINQPLDMGSKVDFFGKISQPQFEEEFLKNGQLSDTAYQNRLLLRKVMLKGGLYPIHTEWWHFNACNKEYASQHFILLK